MTPEPIIWYPQPVSHAFIKQQLVLSAPSGDAWLECACGGPYQLYVNGELIGRQLGQALTEDPMWERCALTGALRPGENTGYF